METFETARPDGDGGPPPASADASAGAKRPRAEPIAHLRSTKGGTGYAAGSTPKKAYPPSTSRRPRPAGKKPDAGPR